MVEAEVVVALVGPVEQLALGLGLEGRLALVQLGSGRRESTLQQDLQAQVQAWDHTELALAEGGNLVHMVVVGQRTLR